MTVAVSKASGLRYIVAVARYEHQAELAKELGADSVLLTQDNHSGMNSETVPHGFVADAVIETTASVAGLRQGVQAVRKGGCLVLAGGFHAPVEVSLREIVDKEVRMVGSSCYAYSGLKRDFEWSMDLILSGRVPAHRLITHRFPIVDIQKAFEVASDKKMKSIKVQIFNPGKS
jgi:threonine dehydrogenase-like Zn-dependent dehydrogenase